MEKRSLFPSGLLSVMIGWNGRSLVVVGFFFQSLLFLAAGRFVLKK